MSEQEESEKPPHYHAFMTDAERWKKSFKDFARANRLGSTEAENALWQQVRSNKLGPRFRRQHAISHYIVDLVCLSAWLIIEIDGDYHLDSEQLDYDGGRTHDLHELGFQMLRFTNEEVLQHPDYVIKLISNRLNTHSLNPESSVSPSPKGEGAGG